MVSGVNGGVQMNRPMQQPPSKPMTDEQKESLDSIISNYDASNISDNDFESMMSEIKSAGIGPSKELRDTLEGAGFEMPDGPPPPPPKGGEAIGNSDAVNELLQLFENGDASESDILSFIDSIKNESNGNSGSIMDQYA